MNQYNHEQHRGQEKEKPPKEGNTRNPQRHGMRHRQITKTVDLCILSKRENVKAKVRAMPGVRRAGGACRPENCENYLEILCS